MKNVKMVILILTIAGVSGILMMVFGSYIANEKASVIVYQIGIGFLVACIVGITVELYIRRQMKFQMYRMLQEVGTNVFKAALRREFPESIWERISTHLFLNPIMRRDVDLDYDLYERLESKSG